MGMISGFRSEVDENCVVMCYYVESYTNLLQTFRDNIMVPSEEISPLKKGPVRCIEMSIKKITTACCIKSGRAQFS
jgi:hypothetical protein